MPYIGWAWHDEHCEWGQFAPESHGLNAPRDISTNTISWRQARNAWKGTNFTPFTLNQANPQQALAANVASGSPFLTVVTANRGTTAKTLRISNGNNVGNFQSTNTGWFTRNQSDRTGGTLSTVAALAAGDEISGFFMAGSKVGV